MIYYLYAQGSESKSAAQAARLSPGLGGRRRGLPALAPLTQRSGFRRHSYVRCYHCRPVGWRRRCHLGLTWRSEPDRRGSMARVDALRAQAEPTELEPQQSFEPCLAGSIGPNTGRICRNDTGRPRTENLAGANGGRSTQAPCLRASAARRAHC